MIELFKNYFIKTLMKSACDIQFGVEVEGLLLDKNGLIKPAQKDCPLANPAIDEEVELLFDSNSAELEVRNFAPSCILSSQQADIIQQIKGLKLASALKDRTLSFDSRLNETTALNTIGTHVHIDLLEFENLRSSTPNFLTLVVAEFMRYYFKVIIDRYCYSRRIKSRIKHIIDKTEFGMIGWGEEILEQEFIPYFKKRDHVKLIKYRPEKGSLEICLPDSFDFSAEPECFERLINDLRKGFYDCVVCFVNHEINPMSDRELYDQLSSVL
ncbi:hypothetical protein GW832_05625 [bacterium]|nr:hypothetical protein [bacterium]